MECFKKKKKGNGKPQETILGKIFVWILKCIEH